MRDPTPASSSSSTRCSGVSMARRRANCWTVGARGAGIRESSYSRRRRHGYHTAPADGVGRDPGCVVRAAAASCQRLLRHGDRVPGRPDRAEPVRPVGRRAAAAFRSLHPVADPQFRGIPARHRRLDPRGVAGVPRPRADHGGRARFRAVQDGPQLQRRVRLGHPDRPGLPPPRDSRHRRGVWPCRRGAGRRPRAAAGRHRRRRPLLEAHQRLQMESVRTVFRGHRAVFPLRTRVRRDCRDRRRGLSPAHGPGGDRPRADLPLRVSVRQLRLHLVLLRPARTQGSVRLGAPEPAPRGRPREGVSVTPQAVDPDSLRAALRTVFAAREYRWSEPSSTWTWLLTQWHRVLDWLDGLRLVSPLRYYIVLGLLTLALVASLVHLGWVVWRSLRPGEPVRPPAPPPAPPRDAAWYSAEARRLSAAGAVPPAAGGPAPPPRRPPARPPPPPSPP